MSKNLKQPFNIIRQHGEPNKAVTLDGLTVSREKHLYFEDIGIVPCLHYDNHFIYEIPFSAGVVGPAFMCTCGSAAVVVGPGSYIHDASISNFAKVEVTVSPENVRVVKITRGFVFACLLRNCVVNPTTQEIWGKHGDNST